MTRDEYLVLLETEPATANQRGRIMAECARLGLASRAERLAVLAALVDLEALGSTAELTQGQGGYLVNLLQRTQDRSELPDVTAAAAAAAVDDGASQLEHAAGDGQGLDDRGEPVTVREAIRRIVLAVAVAAQRHRVTVV